jgi:ankyrin repeat protein
MPTERDMQLIEAARGDTAAIERLLSEGASVSARDATGQTALIAAAWGNHLDAACALIAAGADVNAQDETRQSAYLIATSEGYLELLEMTLDAGADVRSLDSYNGTGLIRAAERGHFDIVARLLETDIAVDHVNRLGLTALLEAVMFGDGGPRYVETVRLLIAAGADVNLADGNGATPLAHARQRGFTEVATLLESAGGR